MSKDEVTKKEVIKCPRLCVDNELRDGLNFSLEAGQAHYIRTVMRATEGSFVRLFNGRDGEWFASLSWNGKKNVDVDIVRRIRVQIMAEHPVCLAFSPIKKHRMDFLIEKAVELGVDRLQPVIMNRTEVRAVKIDRIKQQIIEAAEQCERLTIPVLSESQSLREFVNDRKNGIVIACLEREALPSIKEALKNKSHENLTVVIGPEGGFDDHEQNFLQKADNVLCVSLGARVLRSETAALAALALITA